MTLFLFSRNEILTFTMSFMWGSGCFFYLTRRTMAKMKQAARL